MSGRKLVGLRYWNFTNDAGENEWQFESRDPEGMARVAAEEKRMFWFTLYLMARRGPPCGGPTCGRTPLGRAGGLVSSVAHSGVFKRPVGPAQPAVWVFFALVSLFKLALGYLLLCMARPLFGRTHAAPRHGRPPSNPCANPLCPDGGDTGPHKRDWIHKEQ